MKCHTDLFKVLLDEECELEKLLPAVFEWERDSIIVGSSESSEYLGWDPRPLEDFLGQIWVDVLRRCADTKTWWRWSGADRGRERIYTRKLSAKSATYLNIAQGCSWLPRFAL